MPVSFWLSPSAGSARAIIKAIDLANGATGTIVRVEPKLPLRPPAQSSGFRQVLVNSVEFSSSLRAWVALSLTGRFWQHAGLVAAKGNAMPRLEVWPLPVRRDDGSLTLAAALRLDGASYREVWFRIPGSVDCPLPAGADSFALAALPLAMSLPADVTIYGPVSRSLLAHLEEFQAAWTAWLPDLFTKVELRAAEEADYGKLKGLPAVSTFSGGVDSCWTSLRHARNLAGRARVPLTTGLMLHGFDIPLSQDRAFFQAAERSRAMLRSLGLELATVATNYRTLTPLPWESIFAVGLAACLWLFHRRFGHGLIPASFSYYSLVLPYGSNPVTDSMLGGDEFSIKHDGADLRRADKIERLLAWPEAIANLRVCWEGPDKSRNCGRCEKCVRTLLNFRVNGVATPACFDHQPTDQEIRRLRVREAQLQAMRNLLGSATRRGVRASWVAAVRDCIRASERRERLRRLVPTSWQAPLKRWVRGFSTRAA